MSKWREPEPRVPRNGSVVEDCNGALGIVVRSKGSLLKRRVWLHNVNDSEIYSDEPAEHFAIVSNAVAETFHKQLYKNRGYYVGAVCDYKKNSIPLEIVQMDWVYLRNKMSFCLKDMRQFNSSVWVTENTSVISPFSHNYPDIGNIFSAEDTGLKWKLEVFLKERRTRNWVNCGSPWEFYNKKIALSEVEKWEAVLKIRRVCSVLSSHWKISFPCWIVDVLPSDDKIFMRVKQVESATGSPGYFETAMHAALAIKMIEADTWKKAYNITQDGPII